MPTIQSYRIISYLISKKLAVALSEQYGCTGCTLSLCYMGPSSTSLALLTLSGGRKSRSHIPTSLNSHADVASRHTMHKGSSSKQRKLESKAMHAQGASPQPPVPRAKSSSNCQLIIPYNTYATENTRAIGICSHTVGDYVNKTHLSIALQKHSRTSALQGVHCKGRPFHGTNVTRTSLALLDLITPAPGAPRKPRPPGPRSPSAPGRAAAAGGGARRRSPAALRARPQTQWPSG